jgi:hypothetical protein
VSPEILVRPIPGGCAYRLPQRPLPAALWLRVNHGLGNAELLKAPVLRLLSCLFGSLSTRTTVEVDGNELRWQEWFGPFRTERKRPLALVRKVVIHRLRTEPLPSPPVTATGPREECHAPELGALEVVCGGAQNLVVGRGYPVSCLSALAAELAGKLQVPHEVAASDAAPPRAVSFAGVFTGLKDEDTFDEPAPPPDNRWLAETEGKVLHLTLPAAGYRRDGNAVIVVLALFFLAAPLLLAFAPGRGGQPSPVERVVVCLVSLALSAVSWSCARYHAKRVQTLTVDENGLVYQSTGPVGGNSHKEWRRGEIAAVRVGPSLSRWVTQSGPRRRGVYVIQTDGRQVHVVETDRTPEMRWLATVLRQALGVPPVAAPRPPRSRKT